MKKMIMALILLLSAILLAGTFLQAAGENETAVLDGIYATSVSDNNDAHNLIDASEKTGWVLMPGAGIDEGVMYSFSAYNYISKMRISVPDEKIKAFEIYVNGRMLYDAVSFGSDIAVNRNVKTLYIKIKDTQPGSDGFRINEVYLFGKNGNMINCIAPDVIKGKIEGSSVLEPEEAYNYDFLFDGRRDFGWADGNTKSSGENEFIKFYFDKKVSISKIKIWNGYHRSKTHFDKNEAVASFSFSDENKSGNYRASAAFMPQEIDLGQIFSGKVFTFKVNAVRKGSAYKDLVISEMMFYDGKKWFVLETGKPYERKKNVINRARTGVLKEYLDRRRVYSVKSAGRSLDQSLILRSNGSFVIYKNDINGGSKKNIIGDGNWQIVSNSESKAEVKIFGRMRTIAETTRQVEEDDYNPYAGTSSSVKTVVDTSDDEVIFSDVLDLTSASAVSRKKIIEPMTF